MASIDVITPCSPKHLGLLPEAIVSVAGQTLKPRQHLIGIDHESIGPGFLRNQLAESSKAEWLAFLDADDILYPKHLELLWNEANARGADIVYSPCNYPPGNEEYRFPIGEFSEVRLRLYNYIPVTVLMRESLFRRVGGFPVTAPYEDWGLWLRCVGEGAKFGVVPETTWLYRLHGNPWRPECQ